MTTEVRAGCPLLTFAIGDDRNDERALCDDVAKVAELVDAPDLGSGG